MNDPSLTFIAIGSLLVLLGIAGVIAVSRIIRRQNRERSSNVTVPGVVVAVKVPGTVVAQLRIDGLIIGANDADLISGRLYHPVVRFTDPTGVTRTFLSVFGFNPCQHQVGQDVTVACNAVDPTQAEIDSAVTRWLVPAVFGFFGVMMGLMGLALVGIGILLRSLSAP